MIEKKLTEAAFHALEPAVQNSIISWHRKNWRTLTPTRADVMRVKKAIAKRERRAACA